jgi:hypothetical protein
MTCWALAGVPVTSTVAMMAAKAAVSLFIVSPLISRLIFAVSRTAILTAIAGNNHVRF